MCASALPTVHGKILFKWKPPEVTARPPLLTAKTTRPFASNNRSRAAVHPYASRSPLLGSPECASTTTQLTIIENKQFQQERWNYRKSFSWGPVATPAPLQHFTCLCTIVAYCRTCCLSPGVGGSVRGVQEVRLNHPPGLLLLYDKTVRTW